MSEDALFDSAVGVVLAHEGGLHEDLSDPGGLTNFGFALKRNPDLTADDIRNMTVEEAKARYFAKWWRPYRWRELPPKIATKAFDAAVNIGPEFAVRCLQRALRAADNLVAEDGLLGSRTLAAAAQAEEATLIAAFRSELAAHYRMTAAAHPRQSQDLAGWLARAYS